MANIQGTEGQDIRFGTQDADNLVLFGANDFGSGLGSNDTIRGGTGNDFLFGGAGDDLIFGNADSDFLWGEAGNDTLNGGNGDDVLYGGDGNDRLIGRAGLDVLTGGDGSDTFVFNVRPIVGGSPDVITDWQASNGNGDDDIEDDDTGTTTPADTTSTEGDILEISAVAFGITGGNTSTNLARFAFTAGVLTFDNNPIVQFAPDTSFSIADDLRIV